MFLSLVVRVVSHQPPLHTAKDAGKMPSTLSDRVDPPTAKLYMASVDNLSSVVLKNEKDEDVDVEALTEDKGLVLFLVPEVDTRVCLFFSHISVRF
jgi:hypothetical protein